MYFLSFLTAERLRIDSYAQIQNFVGKKIVGYLRVKV